MLRGNLALSASRKSHSFQCPNKAEPVVSGTSEDEYFQPFSGHTVEHGFGDVLKPRETMCNAPGVSNFGSGNDPGFWVKTKVILCGVFVFAVVSGRGVGVAVKRIGS